MVHALEPSLLLEELDLPLEEIDRVAQDRLQRGGAASAHEGVRILAGGHRGHPHADRVTQELVAGPEGGAETGLVAVVEENGRWGEAAEQRALLGRERRAERGDHVLDTCQHQAEHVEVTLDQDDRLLLPDGALGLVEVVELASLVKDRVLG